MSAAPAHSLLDFLTHQNPAILHLQPKSKTKHGNTVNRNFHRPKVLEEWLDFQPSLIRTSFDERLFQEATKPRPNLPPFPRLLQHNLRIQDHIGTVDLIGAWNEYIVNNALQEISDVFRPAWWIRGGAGYVGLFPDAGATVFPTHSTSADILAAPLTLTGAAVESMPTTVNAPTTIATNTITDTIDYLERFPKEYKQRQVWTFADVERENLLRRGEWVKNGQSHNYAWPIRQAYSYCIQHKCRYGCILSGEEAFIFRIQPLKPRPNDKKKMSEKRTSELKRLLKNELISNGKMQYVRIPWSNHCVGDWNDEQKWTINLAFFYLHILAGNEYEFDWNYKDLGSESFASPDLINPPNSVGPGVVVSGSDIIGEQDESFGSDDDTDDSSSTTVNDGRLSQGSSKTSIESPDHHGRWLRSSVEKRKWDSDPNGQGQDPDQFAAAYSFCGDDILSKEFQPQSTFED